MNYKKIYNSIINRAKKENRIRGLEIYYELHHILPRSMDGDDSVNNLVLLTGREHFICHYLLTKFTINNDKRKMIAAFNIMNISMSKQNRYFNSILYESNRKKLSKAFKNMNHQACKINSNYNMKWIKFDESKVQMKIKLVDTFDYINQGWVYGRNMTFSNVTKIRKKEFAKEKETLKYKKFRDTHIKKYTNVYNLFLLSEYKYFSEFCKYHKINQVNYGTKIKKLFNIKIMIKENKC